MLTDWQWLPCSFDLKRELKKKIEYFNLGNQASFFCEGKEIEISMTIKMDKNLHSSEEQGWVWHKSWNLPFMKVSVEFLNPETQEIYELPKNLYVEVLAVKPFLENLRSFHLVDVGLIGSNKLKISENDCLFSSLRFLTTSYNHKESKFHLTVSLFQKDADSPPIYLKSLISPPIFVDSRKSARNSLDLKKKHLKPFIEKFPIESLRRLYAKKEKKNQQMIENKIENNLRGLFDYLTAPNIRDKVKNPLFLTVIFPACVKLFYDKTRLRGEKIEDVIEEYFLILQRFFSKKGTSNKPQSVFLMSIQFREFAEDHFHIKKILEFYEVFKGSPLEVVSELESIPENFKPLWFNSVDEFEAVYQRIPEPSETNDRQGEGSSSEEESERVDDLSNSPLESEKPSKKLKVEPKTGPKIGEFQIRHEIDIIPTNQNTQINVMEFFELKGKSEESGVLKEESVSSSVKIEVKRENETISRETIQKQEFIEKKSITESSTYSNNHNASSNQMIFNNGFNNNNNNNNNNTNKASFFAQNTINQGLNNVINFNNFSNFSNFNYLNNFNNLNNFTVFNNFSQNMGAFNTFANLAANNVNGFNFQPNNNAFGNNINNPNNMMNANNYSFNNNSLNELTKRMFFNQE